MNIRVGLATLIAALALSVGEAAPWAASVQSVQSLADGGTIAVVGGWTGYDGRISASALVRKGARVQGLFVGGHADALRRGEFIASHHLQALADRVLPLEPSEEVLSHFRSGGDFVGKVVRRPQ